MSHPMLTEGLAIAVAPLGQFDVEKAKTVLANPSQDFSWQGILKRGLKKSVDLATPDYFYDEHKGVLPQGLIPDRLEKPLATVAIVGLAALLLLQKGD